MTRYEIFLAIEKERERQDVLHPLLKTKTKSQDEAHLIKNYFLMADMLAVLVEEVGEVASALQGDGDLKAELIQVASVCVRALENIQ